MTKRKNPRLIGVAMTRTSLAECLDAIRASGSSGALEEEVLLFQDLEMDLVHLQEACAQRTRSGCVPVRMNFPELLEFSECSCWWGDTGGSGEWALELLEDVRTELEVRKDLELGDAGAVVRAQHCLEETLDWAQASERTAVWAALAEEARTRVGVAALTEALEAFLEEEIPGEEVDTTPVWLGVRSWPRVYDEVEVLRKVLGVDHGSRAVVELPMWAALELVGIARENGYARCDVASPGRADALEATRVLWADGAQTLAGAREVAEAL